MAAPHQLREPPGRHPHRQGAHEGRRHHRMRCAAPSFRGHASGRARRPARRSEAPRPARAALGEVNMTPRYANYIDGEWVPGESWQPNINPSDVSDVIGEYAQASAAQAAM